MKKQTAVEWLVNELETHHGFHDIKNTNAYHIAKAIEREQLLKLISFVRVNNKMGKSPEDLLQEYETYKGGEQ